MMSGEKLNIPLHQHPRFTCSSLHNPIVKTFPERVFLQRCFPSVGRLPAFPWSSHVPFENPAGPCRAWHAERPGKGSRLKRILASCVQFVFVLALAGQAKQVLARFQGFCDALFSVSEWVSGWNLYARMSIFRIQCKNWWTQALTPPNYKHPGQPFAIPPDVDTGKTFSTCRPIVGVGDQYEVVQQVSNAAAWITICHTVSLPYKFTVSLPFMFGLPGQGQNEQKLNAWC